MNNAYKKWLPYIERDLRVVETLYKNAMRKNATSWHDWMFVIWNCHQVVEKSLKMIIVAQDIELPRIHDLVRLAEIVHLEKMPNQWLDMLDALRQYYITPRYPDLPLKRNYPRASKEITKKYLAFAQAFFLWTKNYLNIS